MTEAWASYDPVTGEIISIAWSKLADQCVLIDVAIAEKVMMGAEHMTDYAVDVSTEVHALVKKEAPARGQSSFWRLSIIDASGIEILIDSESNGVLVNTPADWSSEFMLFATIKNDPSWLINSWSSTKLRWRGHRAFVSLPNPEKYSFYLRAINEA